jgi:outer membrane protein assembly factor BamB
MHARLLIILATEAILSLAACSSNSAPDGGLPPDAGPADAGIPGPDGGLPPDAGPADAGATRYSWLQFNGDARHLGVNRAESIVGPANVGSLARLYQVELPAVADGAPVALANVNTDGGVRDLLVLTTRAGHLLALDALTGAEVWRQQPSAGGCTINHGTSPCITTSSPAIDPDLTSIYSYGLDGAVHRYRVADGLEFTGQGWPELATLKPFDEKGSAALTIATIASGASFLYVANGGNVGDNGDYQGHITVVNTADGSQKVFNTLCSDQTVHFVSAPGTPDCSEVQSGVWARPGVVFDPDTQRIYFAMGNGTFDPTNYHWGDSVLALNPDGTGNNGNPLDSYTPVTFQQLQDSDADLGSTAPALLPAPPGSRYPHLAVQGGKDAELRLLDLDNLSGAGTPGQTGGELELIAVPQGGPILTFSAVWTHPADGASWIFVANGSGIAGLKISVDASGNPSLQPVWSHGPGGTSPLVANGILFYASSGLVLGLDPASGQQLWNSSATPIGGVHWESPVVVNGVLYITDESAKLTAFSLGGVVPAIPR